MSKKHSYQLRKYTYEDSARNKVEFVRLRTEEVGEIVINTERTMGRMKVWLLEHEYETELPIVYISEYRYALYLKKEYRLLEHDLGPAGSLFEFSVRSGPEGRFVALHTDVSLGDMLIWAAKNGWAREIMECKVETCDTCKDGGVHVH